MLSSEDIIKLLIIIFGFDFFLIIIKIGCYISSFDSFLIYFNLMTHLLLLIGLKWNLRSLLDILHYLVFLNPFLTVFGNHVSLKILALIFIMLIQFMWVYEERCILNEKDQSQKFGYGKSISVFTIILNSILGINVGLSLCLN